MAEANGQMTVGGTRGGEARPDDEATGLEPGAGVRGPSMEAHPAWPMIARLPVTLSASIPLKRFTVRDLLGLSCGQTIESAWATTEDVPLKADALQLSWCEFEVVGQSMALRLTRLA
jgi:flagellar motor switch protein FliM